MGRHRSDGIEWDYEGNGSSDDLIGDLDNTPPEGMSVDEIMQLAEERETQPPPASWPESADHDFAYLYRDEPAGEPVGAEQPPSELPPDEGPPDDERHVPINEPLGAGEDMGERDAMAEHDEPPRKRFALVAAGGAIIGAVALIATFVIGGDQDPAGRTGPVPPGAADPIDSSSPSTYPDPEVKKERPDDPDARPEDGSTGQPDDRQDDDQSDERGSLPGDPGPNPSRRPDPSPTPTPEPSDPSVAPSPTPTDDDCFLVFC